MLPDEFRDNPLFTMVDGIFWLSQETERNSVVRKLQIIKIRGQSSVPGLHTVGINSRGLQAFSRTLGLDASNVPHRKRRRLSIGIAELDKMLGGGILEGDSVLVAGPSGTGKSALATQFIAEGLRRGEPGIMAIFEERPDGYTHRAGNFGLNLKKGEAERTLEVLYLRPLDLSVDETMQEILDAIKRVGAKRLVIDSLVGFEMALAPGFRADFRESLYRMIGALTGAGITILSTVEVEDNFNSFQFSHYAISFLTDDIIRLRYVEIDGQLRKVMVVIKMRGGNHSKDIREYVITDDGVVVIHPRRTDYEWLDHGNPPPDWRRANHRKTNRDRNRKRRTRRRIMNRDSHTRCREQASGEGLRRARGRGRCQRTGRSGPRRGRAPVRRSRQASRDGVARTGRGDEAPEGTIRRERRGAIA